MSGLNLRPLKCPQCGAPEIVREGTRITPCERCGAMLCMTEVHTPLYEVVSNLSASQAVATVRTWLTTRAQTAIFGRPELVLMPFHEIAGRRVGVFEHKKPERYRIYRERYQPGTGDTRMEPEWAYEYKEDTKVMIADVEHMAPAANAPWDLSMFDARTARRLAELRSFDLVEAQRRATVYAEEQAASVAEEERFAQKDTEMVATSHRTLFFPLWSVPVRTQAGEYEVVIDGVTGNVISWRMPESYPTAGLAWGMLAIPGALALGHALHAFIFEPSAFDPIVMFGIGIILTGAAFVRANKPDWRLRRWPEPGTIARFENDGA